MKVEWTKTYNLFPVRFGEDIRESDIPVVRVEALRAQLESIKYSADASDALYKLEQLLANLKDAPTDC